MCTNKQGKKPQSIEDLAYAIKFDFNNYTKSRITQFKSDLAAKLLNILNLNDFTNNKNTDNDKDKLKKEDELENNKKDELENKKEGKLEDNSSKLLTESYRYEEYDGIAFTKAYKSALEKYGMLDEKTGERVPFIVIFRSHYNFKKRDIKKEKLKERSYKVEVKLKADVIKLFLEQQIKTLGNEKIPKDFKFSFENAVEFIMSLDADKESKENVIQRLTDLYTNSYMKRVSGLTTEDDDGNKQENNEFEQTAFGNDVEKERNIDKLCYLIDILFKEMENNKLKQYARYYITMKIILKYKIFGNNNWAINYYIDKDLERFYYEKYSDYTDEKYIKIIIAEYVGKASDTVRKKIDAVKKIIQNNLLKVASKNN